MKKYLVITLLSLTNIAFAQTISGFAMVTDKDGKTNVRSQPNTTANIDTTLANGEVVDCIGDNAENGYCFAFFNGNNMGYIHQSRLTAFENNPALQPLKLTAQTQTTAHYQTQNGNTSLDITVKRVAMDNKQYSHNDSYYKGKRAYGSDGKFMGNPFMISQITVKTNGKTNMINSPLFENAFIRDYEILEDKTYFKNNEIYYNPKTQMLYVMSSIGMGAGTYDVVFEIQNGKLIRRLIWDTNL